MKRLTRYLGLVLVLALVGAGGAGAQATNINQATLAEANQKRSVEEFRVGSLPGARSIPQGSLEPGKDKGEIRKPKDDGRLPMEDHNTRIIIFGRETTQARILAEAVAQEKFHNAAYFASTYDALESAVK